MSVPLRLVRLHARSSSLQISSATGVSCFSTFLTAGRISQNSNARPLATSLKFISSWRFSRLPSALWRPRLPSTPSAHFSILQFTKNTVWNATHHDRLTPAGGGGRKPPIDRPKISWIDTLPPPVIFWGILVINVGVFLAWTYAEGAAVSSSLISGRFDIH